MTTLPDLTVPITPVRRSWSNGGSHCTRFQIPLKLSWAMTIHKAQGLTLSNVVVDVGKKEFTSGLTFVACSRVRQLKDLLFTAPFPYERLSNLSKSQRLQERLQEDHRLLSRYLSSHLYHSVSPPSGLPSTLTVDSLLHQDHQASTSADCDTLNSNLPDYTLLPPVNHVPSLDVEMCTPSPPVDYVVPLDQDTCILSPPIDYLLSPDRDMHTPSPPIDVLSPDQDMCTPSPPIDILFPNQDICTPSPIDICSPNQDMCTPSPIDILLPDQDICTPSPPIDICPPDQDMCTPSPPIDILLPDEDICTPSPPIDILSPDGNMCTPSPPRI